MLGDGARFVSAAYFHLKVGQWLSIAVCLALMLCAVIFTPQTRVGRRGGIAAAVLAAACAAGIFVVHTTQMPRGGIMEHNEYLAWNDAESHDTLADAYAEFTNANRCLMFSGLYQYTVRGAAVTIWPQTTADTERIAELDAYYAAHPKQAADTPMTGAFAGKSLILIMMESVDDWLVTPGVYAESIPAGAGGRVFPELLRADLPRGGNVQLGVYGEYRHDRAGVSGAQFVLQ